MYARRSIGSPRPFDFLSDSVRRSVPAWNRERLVEQFQRIDGSTRSEAEREIAALELSFGKASRDVRADRRRDSSRKTK